MDEEQLARIAEDPRYRGLIRRRGRFTWTLSLIMLAAYFGYVLLIAFNKDFLARPVAQGAVTSIGIPLGLGVILLAILLTGIYVRRASREFDAEVEALRREIE